MSNNKKPKKTKGIGSGIIAFGVVFALFAAIFRPHTFAGLLLTFALSGFAGAIVRTMAQGLDLSVKEKTPESLKKMQGNTGNPDVDALLDKGREMIMEIRAENKKIPDESLTKKLDELENKCAEVFRAVYDKPAKASQIRKFMDYYLPTTLKMVKGYRTLGERNLSSADVIAARRRIDDALGIVLKGCDKMLDNLYRDDVLDITTDIDVLEQMLKRDGLTESDLEKAAASARAAAQMEGVQAASAAGAYTTAAQMQSSQAERTEKSAADQKIDAAAKVAHTAIDAGLSVAKRIYIAAKATMSDSERDVERKKAAEAASAAQLAAEQAAQAAEARKAAQEATAREAARRAAETKAMQEAAARKAEQEAAAREAAKRAAEAKAAQEAAAQEAAKREAERREVPVLKWDSGVKQQFEQANSSAQQHKPQVPTLSGGYYPSYDGQAVAQAPKPEGK